MSRSSLILSGLPGLAGAILLTAACVAVMTASLIPVLLTGPLLVWGLFLFLLTLSVLEIPLMIFTMRRMAASANPRAATVVLLTNMAYTFFAAVYAAPFILLAGSTQTELGAGIALAALSFVRFISSLVFLRNEQQL
ncbi:MAG: hypothetical protein Kow0031_38920 [Anaerolineae bacterium]